ALGFFVIHIAGRRYGVYTPEATMLGCSFDQVGRRIANRGAHRASFARESEAGAISDAFRNAVYGDEPDESYFGIPLDEFRELFSRESRSLVWAPDGDEAFDDGSHLLHFDVEDRVRLIAFRSSEGFVHDPTTLSDLWLSAAAFYEILNQWHEAFEREWAATPKISRANDGAG